MNILFIVLNEIDLLDDILDEFIEIGIKGATILDSQGMGSVMTNNGQADHFFASIRSFLDNARPYNKTIFTVVDDEELLELAIKSVKEIVGDINKPGVGLMFTMPVNNVYGM